jgi:hypothetical protein
LWESQGNQTAQVAFTEIMFDNLKIGHLTNYGQNTYFWTFWTFSHEGKSRNDTKPDLRVLADSASRRESENRKN